MKKQTIINNYISPDELTILIRNNGGSAYVEEGNVITNKPISWVRKLTRKNKWLTP